MLTWCLKKDRQRKREIVGRHMSREFLRVGMRLKIPRKWMYRCRDAGPDVDDAGVDGCARRSFLSDFRCMRNAPEAKHYLHLMRTLAAPRIGTSRCVLAAEHTSWETPAARRDLRDLLPTVEKRSLEWDSSCHAPYWRGFFIDENLKLILLIQIIKHHITMEFIGNIVLHREIFISQLVKSPGKKSYFRFLRIIWNLK